MNEIKDHCRYCGKHRFDHNQETGQCPISKPDSTGNVKWGFATYLEKNPFFEVAPKLYTSLKALIPYAEHEISYLADALNDESAENVKEELQKDYQKACNALSDAQNAIKLVEYNLPEKQQNRRFKS